MNVPRWALVPFFAGWLATCYLAWYSFEHARMVCFPAGSTVEWVP